MKNKSLLYTFFLVLLSGCIDQTLDKQPKLAFSEANSFANFDIVQTYSLGFYTIFPGYSSVDPQNSEFNGDLFMDNNASQGSDWIWNRVTVPTTSSDWDFSFIRRCNLMLANVGKSSMTEKQINHWKSIGYFFRAFDYFNKLSKFGDVPWIDVVVTNDDTDILYGPRNSRDEVAQNILRDLLYAEANILAPGTNNIIANSISADVVRALISRFGLFEGTWRKYHGLSNANTYLKASTAASEVLLKNNPTLHPNYDEVFNSVDLKGMPGILLYKQYVSGQFGFQLTGRLKNSSGNWDLTRRAIDLYLLKDGKTRWKSPLFDGDKNPYDEFRNRDLRMLYSTVPPFRVTRLAESRFTWAYNPNPQNREYIDLMAKISDPAHKLLPSVNHQGFLLYNSPHFRDFNEGIPYNVTRTGYFLFKYYNTIQYFQYEDYHDAPIFRMGEVLLNFAEAKWELGEFNQTIADQTINKLRVRGKVAAMMLTDINTDFDPTRDATVDPILWEIRRERAIELMAEGARWDDLRRWKKMNYTNDPKLGMWAKNADYGNKLRIQNGAPEGYIQYFGTPPAFPDHYYLFPIPSNDIVLNPKLVQNPGW